MKPNSSTPRQLVQFILVGTLLLLVSYAMDFLPFHTPKDHIGFWRGLWQNRLALLEVAVFLSGAVVIWRSYKRLDEGVRWEWWTEGQIDSARRLAFSRVLSWAIGVLLLGSISILVLGHVLHFRQNVLLLIYSTWPLNYTRSKLRKPTPPRVPVDWHTNKPFFSSHWGEPPATN